jgi:hypothetical protein
VLSKVLLTMLVLISVMFLSAILYSTDPSRSIFVAGIVCLVTFYLARFITRKTPGLLFQTVGATLALVAVVWTGFVTNLGTAEIDRGHSISVWVVIVEISAGWLPLLLLLLIKRFRVTNASPERISQ